MQIFILYSYFQIFVSYLPIRTEICRITISITMLVVLQGISIIYLPLQPKLEVIRNIFRSGFDLSVGQTENISGRGKLQMDRKCQNLHTVLSFHIPRGPLNPLTKPGGGMLSHLEWILIAWSPNLCKPWSSQMLRLGQNFYLLKEKRVIPIPWTWPARPEKA